MTVIGAAAICCVLNVPAAHAKGNPFRVLTPPGILDGGIAARARAQAAKAKTTEAITLAKNGRLQEAAQALQAIVQADPQNLEARTWLGGVYFQTKNFDGALEQYEAVRRVDHLANFSLAEALVGAGKISEALEVYKEALRDGSKSNAAVAGPAKVEERIAALEQYLKHVNEAERRTAASQYDAALSEFNAARTMFPSQALDQRIAELSLLRDRASKKKIQTTLRIAGGIGTGIVALIVIVFALTRRSDSEPAETAQAPAHEGVAGDGSKAGRLPFRRRSIPELKELASSAPPALDAAVAEYVAARKTGELAEDLAHFSEQDRLAPMARSLLRCGDFECAFKLLKRLPTPGEQERQIRATIEKLVRLRRPGAMFSAQETYGERLSLANSFTAMELHDEAIGIIDEVTLVAASREEMDAGAVAEHFHRAGKAARLVELAARAERRPEFYANYANALHVWGSDEAGLSLLQKKKPWEDGDYVLLVAMHRSLGALERIDEKTIPEPHRVLLAEGFLDEGKPEKSLAILGGVSRPAWRAREYGAALRALGKLDQYTEAAKLYLDIQRSAPAGQAPELHYLFAVLSERAGQFDRAKVVYRAILAEKAGYKDAAERLKNLEAIPAEETSRVTTMLASVATMAQSPAEAAAFLSGLEKQERAGAIGERLLLVRPAGVGGMGVVYKARDLKMQREVAVKRLRGELAADPVLRKGILEEARTLSSLSHPNIVSFFGTLEAGGVTYLIFEFVDGETLRDIVVARGRLPTRDAVKILLPVSMALEHAHERGVVHRDIKPGNVMLDRQGQVKVMDFGLARQSVGGLVETRVAGTPAYMPPEQYDGKVSLAADVYAFGATAYELLTGKLPFPAGELLSAKLREAYEPLPADIPKPLADLVAQCFKPDPGARPQAAAVSKVLAAILANPITSVFRVSAG